MNIKPEELLPIVAKLSESYTSNESTSIRYDTARQLMGAVIYCIEEYETFCSSTERNDSQSRDCMDGYTLHNPDLHFLQMPETTSSQTDAFTLYETGYQMVQNKTKAAKSCYDSFILSFDGFDNYFYESTIRKGIPKFFLYYDPKFNPQNHILTLDYTTLCFNETKSGIDIIYDYLKAIQKEQEFLHCFERSQVTTILNAYDSGYKDLPINPCQIMFRYLLCRELSKKNSSSPLLFTSAEQDTAIDFVLGHSRGELESYLNKVTESMIHLLPVKDNLCSYLASDIKDFLAELINAVQHDCIERLFYSL